MTSERTTVLAIDPGTHKCGIAVLRSDDCYVLHRSVEPTEALTEAATRLSKEYSPSIILIGSGTSARTAIDSIRALDIAPVELVDETLTSVAARKRYFKEHPPRGLRRLLPTSLQTPPQPYDDYVAVILAERYITSQPSSPDS